MFVSRTLSRSRLLPLQILAAAGLLIGGCSSGPTELNPDPELKEIPADKKNDIDSPEGILFESAKKSYQSRLYSVAKEQFTALQNNFPTGPYAEYAELKIADCSFYVKDYDISASLYEEYAKNHPGSLSAAYALLMSARSYHLSSKGIGHDAHALERAREMYSRLVEQYPDSIYSRQAAIYQQATISDLTANEMRVAEFYRKQGKEEAYNARLKIIKDKWQPLALQAGRNIGSTGPLPAEPESAPVVTEASRVPSSGEEQKEPIQIAALSMKESEPAEDSGTEAAAPEESVEAPAEPTPEAEEEDSETAEEEILTESQDSEREEDQQEPEQTSEEEEGAEEEETAVTETESAEEEASDSESEAESSEPPAAEVTPAEEMEEKEVQQTTSEEDEEDEEVAETEDEQPEEEDRSAQPPAAAVSHQSITRPVPAPEGPVPARLVAPPARLSITRVECSGSVLYLHTDKPWEDRGFLSRHSLLEPIDGVISLTLPLTKAEQKNYNCFGISDLEISSNATITIESSKPMFVRMMSNPSRLAIITKNFSSR